MVSANPLDHHWYAVATVDEIGESISFVNVDHVKVYSSGYLRINSVD
jgi:hypothetical protein